MASCFDFLTELETGSSRKKAQKKEKKIYPNLGLKPVPRKRRGYICHFNAVPFTTAATLYRDQWKLCFWYRWRCLRCIKIGTMIYRKSLWNIVYSLDIWVGSFVNLQCIKESTFLNEDITNLSTKSATWIWQKLFVKRLTCHNLPTQLASAIVIRSDTLAFAW